MPVVIKSVFSAFFSTMCMLNTDYTRDGIYSARSFLCMWPKNFKYVRRLFALQVPFQIQREHTEGTC